MIISGSTRTGWCRRWSTTAWYIESNDIIDYLDETYDGLSLRPKD